MQLILLSCRCLSEGCGFWTQERLIPSLRVELGSAGWIFFFFFFLFAGPCPSVSICSKGTAQRPESPRKGTPGGGYYSRSTDCRQVPTSTGQPKRQIHWLVTIRLFLRRFWWLLAVQQQCRKTIIGGAGLPRRQAMDTNGC